LREGGQPTRVCSRPSVRRIVRAWPRRACRRYVLLKARVHGDHRGWARARLPVKRCGTRVRLGPFASRLGSTGGREHTKAIRFARRAEGDFAASPHSRPGVDPSAAHALSNRGKSSTASEATVMVCQPARPTSAARLRGMPLLTIAGLSSVTTEFSRPRARRARPGTCDGFYRH
jgi:hypothetical protein